MCRPKCCCQADHMDRGTILGVLGEVMLFAKCFNKACSGLGSACQIDVYFVHISLKVSQLRMQQKLLRIRCETKTHYPSKAPQQLSWKAWGIHACSHRVLGATGSIGKKVLGRGHPESIQSPFRSHLDLSQDSCRVPSEPNQNSPRGAFGAQSRHTQSPSRTHAGCAQDSFHTLSIIHSELTQNSFRAHA